MTWLDSVDRFLGYATLRATRARLRSGRAKLLIGAIAAVYALISMFVGQMIILGSVNGGPAYVQVVQGGNALQWWNYPALILVEPWGIVTLPFFSTIAMVLVSVGVGVGATMGVLLIGPVLTHRSATDRRSATAGAVAGVGPAITGLATLGACCCTSCAGLVGVSVVAAASGASAFALLLNNWYIGVFQLGVVYVSLLAQERALRLTAEECPVPPPMDRRFAAGAALRLGLMIAGITWSLAMFAEWSDTPPLTASAAIWYHWTFEHQLLSITAVAAGLFPREFAFGFRRLARSVVGRAGRLALAVAGISWGTWVPATLVAFGLGGFVNELFGYLGLSAAVGAEAPDVTIGPALYFHWAFQHLLLSGFAIALAVAPLAATAPLLWTVTAGRGASASASASGGEPPEERSARPTMVATERAP